MEHLFSTDSFCHKFIRERNDTTSGSAQMKIGTLREDVFVNQILLVQFPHTCCRLWCYWKSVRFFCQWVAKEASVSISINNGKMGTFGIGAACPSLVSRSAGRAGKWAWSPECSTVHQFVLSTLVLFPRAHWCSKVAAIRGERGAAVSVSGGLLGGHGLTWLGGKQVRMWAWVIVVAMAQNLKLRKL